MGVASGCGCKEVNILVYRFLSITYPYSSCRCSFLQQHPTFCSFFIIESVESIIRDEPDSPLTQYITNTGISRARYTITLFKHHHRILRISVI